MTDDTKDYLKIAGITVVTLVAMVAAFILTTPSYGHDHNRPDLTSWFRGLHNKLGGSCCDGSDGISLDDPDWDTVNGHYRVRLDGDWYDVPDRAVVEGENKAGHAVVWPYRAWSGTKGAWVIRCFMAGTLS